MINTNNIQILKWMSKPNTDILTSLNKISLIRKTSPSETTQEKVALISQFLSANRNELCQNWEYLKLVSALKEKLISEAGGNLELIQKIQELSFKKSGNTSPTISILKGEKVVKCGLIFETKNQNTAMFINLEKLLMHKTPVIVNREFMLAHRHRFLGYQIPLQFFHQKGGNFIVIVPEGAEVLGFNAKELILGSFKELLPHEKENDADALDRLLLPQDRVSEMAGHGSNDSIAGLPLNQFEKVQNVLHAKGMKFGILKTCLAGGPNINVIQKTPFPLMLMSSSEVSSKSGYFLPSYNPILECARNSILTHSFDPKSLLSNEKVVEIIEQLPKENTPTLLLPNATRLGYSNNGEIIRLEDHIISAPLRFKGDEGRFVSPGGSGYHILKEVVSEKGSLEAIAEKTFSLMDLSQSSTLKAIFIQKMQCSIKTNSWFSNELENVIFFASQYEQSALYCQYGFFHLWNAKEGWKQIKEGTALYSYYLCFVKTMAAKGTEGWREFLAFQKQFFGKTKLPLIHKLYTLLIQAYCFKDRKGYLDLFLNHLQNFKQSLEDDIPYHCEKLKYFAHNLQLTDFEKAIQGESIAHNTWDSDQLIETCRQGEVDNAKEMLKTCSKEALEIILGQAVRTNEQNAVDVLISCGADPNEGLFQCNQIEMVDFLLANGARVDFKSEEGKTPLLLAIVKRDLAMVTHLLKKGAPLFAAEEFESALFDPELLQVILDHSTPEQLTPQSIVMALCAENYELASALIKKGVKPKCTQAYLEKMKNRADTKVLKWIDPYEMQIFEKKSDEFARRAARQVFYHQTFGKALEFSSFEVIQFLKKLYNQKWLKPSSYWGFQRMIHFNAYKLTELPSVDQKALAELKMGSEEENRKLFKYCIDTEQTHMSPSTIQYRLWQGESDQEARTYFLNAIIQRSPKDSFKVFYTALQEQNFVQINKSLLTFTDQEIAEIWNHCPPSTLLRELKNPSEVLIRLVFEQLKKSEIDKMHEQDRMVILADMLALCKNYTDLFLQIPLYGSMKEGYNLIKWMFRSDKLI